MGTSWAVLTVQGSVILLVVASGSYYGAVQGKVVGLLLPLVVGRSKKNKRKEKKNCMGVYEHLCVQS